MENKNMSIKEKIINNIDLTEKEIKQCIFGNIGEYIDEIELDMRRWTQTIKTIIEINKQLYAIKWYRGLTECQENEFPYQPYKVKKETRVITKTIIEYVAMED